MLKIFKRSRKKSGKDNERQKQEEKHELCNTLGADVLDTHGGPQRSPSSNAGKKCEFPVISLHGLRYNTAPKLR